MNARLPIVMLDEPLIQTRRPLRIALVTETYPPEVNGVSLTVARIAEGLRQRGHELQLVRPRQAADGSTAQGGNRLREVLVAGAPIPCYSHLRMGLPAGRELRMLWRSRRPDLVHIATEGPLGWSALRAARELGIVVTSDFRTNFQAYSGHYRMGWLRGVIWAYLRRFHNLAGCTMVPTEALRAELQAAGFERATTTTACCSMSAGWRRRRTSTCCCRPMRPCASSTQAGAWCWWATARCASGWAGAAPRPSSPGSAVAPTWRRTMRRPICSSSPA
jgi:hypothetical protein